MIDWSYNGDSSMRSKLLMSSVDEDKSDFLMECE